MAGSLRSRVASLERAAPRVVRDPEPLSDHELATRLTAWVAEHQGADTHDGRAALAFCKALEEVEGVACVA